MVQIGVEVIDADGVDAENLHESSITQASIGISKGILALLRLVAGAAAGLVANTNHLEAVASVGNVEFISLDFDGLDGGDNRGGQGHESGLDLKRAHIRLVETVLARLGRDRALRVWRRGCFAS